MQLRDARAEDFDEILQLNAESLHFLSPLDLQRLNWLHGMAAYRKVAESGGRVQAFLLAFREGAAYDSLNYRWFADRYAQFVYIDRVVVGGLAQGQGLGRRFYDDLFTFARASGVQKVTCEFDVDPPNEPSRRFHAAFGFQEVGTQRVGANLKRVSLQAATAKVLQL